MIGLAIAVALLAFAAPAAADEAYLKIPGIKGGSQESGYLEQIKLDSFQVALSKPPEGGATQFTEATVTKALDKSSPYLLKEVATATYFPSATVSFTKVLEGSTFRYLRYCLGDVKLTSLSTSYGGDTPTESLSMKFDRLVQTYYQPKPGGGPPNFWTGGYDIATAMGATSVGGCS